jgi:hypothetical protein
MENNKLLSMYQTYIQNTPFQNNTLLQNNPMFMNYQNNDPNTMRQMVQQAKESYQIKQIEKINDFENKLDKEKIKSAIIKPITITKNQKDKLELDNKWKSLNANFDKERKEYWDKRTNQPYKNILKNIDYTKEIKKKEDLVVHNVTKKDKEGIEEKYDEEVKKIEKHNNELKVIYSTSNKNEHKKNFEYNQVYKYRLKHDPKDHTQLKEDKIKYYKEQQKKQEEGKKKMDELYALINDGIFDKDDLEGILPNKQEDSLVNNEYEDGSIKDKQDSPVKNKKEYYQQKQKKK